MSSELKKLTWGVSPTGITIWGVILAVIMAIIAPLVTTLIYGLVYPYTFMELVWAWVGLLFLLVIAALHLLLKIILKFLGLDKSLTVGDSVLIYLAISASAGYAFSTNFLLYHYIYMTYGDGAYISDYGKLMPGLWVPNTNITIGGKSIHVLAPLFDPDAHALLVSQPNWYMTILGAWAPSLALWILVFLGLAVSQIGFALLLRKPWIEEEMLPFPYAQMAVEVMRVGGFRGVWEYRNISKIMFLIGALVGFVSQLPSLLEALNIIPSGSLPPLYGQLLVSIHGGYDVSPYIGNNVALMITVAPLFIALAFLMPLDILITAVAWYIIMYIILPPIEVMLGIVPLTQTQDAHTNYYTIGHWYGLMPHLITRGIALGFPIMWFILVWRHISNLENREVKWGHIFAWGGLAFTWILLAISGVEAHIALLVVVVTLLLYITWMRIRAETTWTTAIFTYGPWWHEMLVLPWLPYRFSGNWNSKGAFTAAASFYPLVTDRTLATTPGPALMEGFKLAKITGIRTRKIVMIGLIAVVLGIVISFLTNLLGGYAYGWKSGKWIAGADTGLEPSWINTMIHNNQVTHMSNDPLLWLPQFIIGIILGALLVWIRVLLPGIPFNPLGILIGDMPVTGVLMFVPNVIALVVKMLYIKIAGVESYEKHIVPLMAGMAIFSFLTAWLAFIIGGG